MSSSLRTTKPKRRHINVTAALALLKTNASHQVEDIIDTAIADIERLQRIELAALAIVVAKTDEIELDVSHDACQTILELAE